MVEVRGTFFFMDGTKMILKWPRQSGGDPSTLASNIKNALESEKIMVEVDGQLFVIPTRNIKYFKISPAPEKLPQGVLKGAQFDD